MNAQTRHERLRRFLLALAILCLPALGGCIIPPPYGPAYYDAPAPVVVPNGYVRTVGGVVLVFDSGWNGYVVRGRPGYYWHASRFYRWRGEHWESSRHLQRGWRVASAHSVPPGLARRYARHGHGGHATPPHSGHSTGSRHAYRN